MTRSRVMVGGIGWLVLASLFVAVIAYFWITRRPLVTNASHSEQVATLSGDPQHPSDRSTQATEHPSIASSIGAVQRPGPPDPLVEKAAADSAARAADAAAAVASTSSSVGTSN
jgi:septal ring-binding cell division protein DamX